MCFSVNLVPVLSCLPLDCPQLFPVSLINPCVFKLNCVSCAQPDPCLCEVFVAIPESVVMSHCSLVLPGFVNLEMIIKLTSVLHPGSDC